MFDYCRGPLSRRALASDHLGCVFFFCFGKNENSTYLLCRYYICVMNGGIIETQVLLEDGGAVEPIITSSLSLPKTCSVLWADDSRPGVMFVPQ